ncbi:hypothetical protein HY68_04145 [Streptomyces sp. AcH 505]|uniref:hypothetical protein n=1 Tax=Streptomyces sp. AcH 505 TaxID=352211 RepID=UPI00059222D7|nr:hypothetical protein HY68_04145 [Streptomyces sp. AcH 505]
MSEDEQIVAARAACRFCKQPTDDPVKVGLTHSLSGPGWDIEACPGCVRFRRLLPFDEYPPEPMGDVRLTDGTILGTPEQAAAIMLGRQYRERMSAPGYLPLVTVNTALAPEGALRRHLGDCRFCRDDGSSCPTGTALYRVAQEAHA